MAAKALGVLAHVATFWAGLRRGQQVGKAAFLATQWGLQQVAVAIGPRAEAQEPFSRAQWGGTDRLIKVALLEASLQAAGKVGSGRAGIKVREGSPTAPTTPFAEATGWGGHFVSAGSMRPEGWLPWVGEEPPRSHVGGVVEAIAVRKPWFGGQAGTGERAEQARLELEGFAAATTSGGWGVRQGALSWAAASPSASPAPGLLTRQVAGWEQAV